MNRLHNRVDKLEEHLNPSNGKEWIVFITTNLDMDSELPDPEKEIARQRKEGRNPIVVHVRPEEGKV